MTSKKRQTVTVEVETVGNRAPSSIVAEILRTNPQVTHIEFQDFGDVEDVPGPNRQRLIRLAQWAAAEDAKRQLGLPNEWNQGAWLSKVDGVVNSCGTACCIAGKVAVEDGGVPVMERLGDWDDAPLGMDTSRVIFPDNPNKEIYVREHAKKALGLTYAQADLLFSGSNGLDDVLGTIQQILREAGPDMVTVRRPREGRGALGVCDQGSICDICYEDVQVPADEVTDEDQLVTA